jgi:hypothetical protein
MHGRGRDVLAYDENGNYITDGSHPAYKALGDVYAERSADSPVRVKWGVTRDGKQVDPGHFELEDDDTTPAPALKLDGVLEPPLKLDGILEPVDDDVISINARNAVTPAPQSFAPLPQRQSPDLQTQEGREARDSRAASERSPGAYLEVSVPVSDVANADGSQLVRDAYKSAVVARGVPPEFFDKWEKENNPTGYHITDRPGGTELTAADAYDEGSKAARLRLDANHVSKIVDDYKASRGSLTKLEDWATSGETSPGEKFIDAAGAVAKPVGVALDYASRPFRAASAAFWVGYNTGSPSQVTGAAVDVYKGEDPGPAANNALAEGVRHNQTLGRINPRLPALLGAVTEAVADPANLIPLGLVGKVAKAGRLAEGARAVGMLDRGLVEARPLGLLEEAAAREAASAPDDLLRSAGYTVERVAAPNRTEGGAASEVWKVTADDGRVNIMRDHTELSDFAEGVAARQEAARLGLSHADAEALRYARERRDFYTQQAEAAADPKAKANAKALADEYGADAARLEGGAQASPSGAAAWAPRRASLVDRSLDILGIPKAVMASGDLSAPGRQGIVFLLTEPKASADALGDMFRSISGAGHERVLAEMAAHPKFGLAQDSGLYLANFGAGEEVFGGTIARRIPGVKVSDRTFETFLDSQRLRVFNEFSDELIADGITPATHPEEFKSLASWINKATGRGDLGRFDKLSRVGNALMFSPKLAVSRFQILSPTTYMRMTPAARGIALKKMLQFTGTLGGLMGAAYLSGADITLDPRKSDFGKVQYGKTHIDLSGGNAYTVRFLVNFAHSLYKAGKGEQMKKGQAPVELATQFLRSKLSPAASLAVDYATGSTMEGEKFTWKGAAFERTVPLFVQDLTKAMEQEGWVGAVHASPSFFGFGVNTYRERGGRRGFAPAESNEQPAPTPTPSPSPSASPTPQLNLDGIVEPAAPGGVESNYMRLEGEPVSRNVDADPSPLARTLTTGELIPADPRARVELVRKVGSKELKEAAGSDWDSLSLRGKSQQVEEDYRATMQSLKGRTKRQMSFASEASPLLQRSRQVEAERSALERRLRSKTITHGAAETKTQELADKLGHVRDELTKVRRLLS